MPPLSCRRPLLPGLLAMALASCGGGADKDAPLATLDAPLTRNAADPALREALETPLASDPDLTGEANRDAVRPSDRPLNGALPLLLPPAQAKEAALRLAGGRLVPAPAATQSITSTGTMPATLAGLARQRLASGGERCDDGTESHDMGWSGRLPAALPIYPGAHVTEAAGADEAGRCAFRAVSFTTGVAVGEVVDFYATMAKRGGYSVEHAEHNGADVLDGAKGKDGGAYFLRVEEAPGGGSAVDLVVTGHDS